MLTPKIRAGCRCGTTGETLARFGWLRSVEVLMSSDGQTARVGHGDEGA